MKSTFRRHNKQVKITRKNKTNKKSIKSSNKYRRTRSRKNRIIRLMGGQMLKIFNSKLIHLLCRSWKHANNSTL